MFIHREQAFFKKITDDINMVNTWYVERLEEYKGKVEVYEKQVDRFCELRQKNEMSLLSQSQTFRQLEFGLKELYRMLGYLKNYCMLNKQAVDKILKKHDKNSTFKSRGTINNAISHLSFYRQRDLPEVIATVECLWRVFVGDKKSKRMNDLKNVYSPKPALNGFVVGLNVAPREPAEAYTEKRNPLCLCYFPDLAIFDLKFLCQFFVY